MATLDPLAFLAVYRYKANERLATATQKRRGTHLLNQLQSNQPQHLTDRETPSAECEERLAQAKLSAASYAIGKLIGEVWDHPDTNLDEVRVASTLCFFALADGVSNMSIEQIVRSAGLNSRRAGEALENLVAAGIVNPPASLHMDGDRSETKSGYGLRHFDREMVR
ncbi:hypothetical protein ABIF65_000579 [Bradyrhizobium japonicum]